MKPRTFATIWGTQLQTSQSGFLAALALWLVLTLVGWQLLDMEVGTAVIFGFLGTLLHFVATMGHHLGHAYAAHRVGYPMSFIRPWYLLATERYPKNEPTLPAEIHIKRALGGPAASLLLSFLSLIFILLLNRGTLAYYLAFFSLLDNFLIFFLGSLLPLGFTDGSTLLYWTRHKQAQ